jgi:hypothetical protein
MPELYPAKSSVAAPMRAVPFLLALLLASPIAHAASVDTKGVTPCAFSAWSSDQDPAGLNVRAAPRADAPVLAKLPPPRRGINDTYAVEFRVIGSRDGWLLIENAKFVDYDGGAADQPVFAGPGWVSGTKIGFEINDAKVRTGPGADAPVKAELMGDGPDGAYGPDSAAVDRVFGCAGGFADVLLHMSPKGRPMRGWVTRLCANQVTTCV